MKETTVKISVTQDGLLPDEITVLGTIFLPSIQKQLLKSVGFEKIDRGTFAGVIPAVAIDDTTIGNGNCGLLTEKLYHLYKSKIATLYPGEQN